MSTPLLASHPNSASHTSLGLSNRLGWGHRPALVLIDICRAYWHENSPLSIMAYPEGKSSPDSMRRLLAAARKGQCPVIWAQVRYNHPKMIDGAIQYKKSPGCSIWLEGDTRGMDAWLEGLTPDWDEEPVILKKNPSAFFGTNLTGQLNALGVDTIVLCGVSTSGCVRATAVDAIGNGFRPMVVEEASGDRSMEIQRATLFDLDAMWADVVLESEAVGKLEKGW